MCPPPAAATRFVGNPDLWRDRGKIGQRCRRTEKTAHEYPTGVARPCWLRVQDLHQVRRSIESSLLPFAFCLLPFTFCLLPFAFVLFPFNFSLLLRPCPL